MRGQLRLHPSEGLLVFEDSKGYPEPYTAREIRYFGRRRRPKHCFPRAVPAAAVDRGG
jgi:hypothetical protein